MRLFIAAELPGEMLDALAETSARLRGSVHGRYVATDSLHLTLAFLGEVPGTRVEDVIDALQEGCRDFASMDVSLGELGSFGRRKTATLWQGVCETTAGGTLAALAQSIRNALKDHGFSFDEKSFRAHITLMRKADLTTGTLSSPAMAIGLLDTVTLFRSDLSGSRPVYEALHSVTLQTR